MQKLITVINTAIPFGRALNAAAHTALGMGHRIPQGKCPGIQVYIASKDQIREFKQAANQIYKSHSNSAIYADFTSTMINGSTAEQISRTKNTAEKDIEYFAVTICADELILATLEPIITKFATVPSYKALTGYADAADFDFLPVPNLPDNNDPIYDQYSTQKAALVFNKKQDIAESINAMLAACLDLGKKAPLMALHLLTYIDADGEKHPNISYHAFPIITAKNQGKLTNLAAETSKDPNLTSTTCNDANGNESVLCIFGETDTVNIYSKQCSLWNKEALQEACEK